MLIKCIPTIVVALARFRIFSFSIVPVKSLVSFKTLIGLLWEDFWEK